MSAWPEAVWITKKIINALDLENKITEVEDKELIFISTNSGTEVQPIAEGVEPQRIFKHSVFLILDEPLETNNGSDSNG